MNPDRIVVVGNPIVDVLDRYYFARRDRFEMMATPSFFADRGLVRSEYYVLTCHRRENTYDLTSLRAILELVGAARCPVYFPASYRRQKQLRSQALVTPANVIIADPIGYEEMICLLVNSCGVFTDSGTVVEEACVLEILSVQVRRATERPQVYEVDASVKFDQSDAGRCPVGDVMHKFELLRGRSWQHPFGDGRSSERIAVDLRRRLLNQTIAGHQPEQYHVPIASSFRGDDLELPGS